MVKRGLQGARSILSVRCSFLIATEPTFTSLPRSGYGYSRRADILTSASSPPSSTISRVLRPISPSEGRSSLGSTKRAQSNLGSRRRRSGPGPCGAGDNLRTFATAVRAVLLDADLPRDASSAGHGPFMICSEAIWRWRRRPLPGCGTGTHGDNRSELAASVSLTEHCGVRCGGPVGLRVRQTSRVVQRQRPSNSFDRLTKENDGLCWSVLDCLFQLGSASASAVSSAKKCEINHIQPAQNSIDDRPQDRVILRI
jgi:hypothetical protein